MRAVFIVESASPLLKLLGWALIEEGLKVSRSTDLQDALTRLPGIPISAVIINADLSAGQLRDYVDALRGAAPSTPIVALATAATADGDHGADAVVREPYSVDALVALIKNLA